MPKKIKKSSYSPFSIRFSPAEKEQIVRDAGNLPIGTYIRSKVLDKKYRAAKKQKELAQLLAQLGRSSIASNFNQIAKAVKNGTLPVTPETEILIQETSRALLDIRNMLVKSLGLSGDCHDT